MKHRFFTLLMSALALIGFTAPLKAQDLIFSGAVGGDDDSDQRPGCADDADGVASGADPRGGWASREPLRPGMRVSVAYLKQGRDSVVSKVLVPSLAQPAVTPLITDPR